MRSFGFTTLVDPFEARFGRRWAAVLSVPAMAAEVFWSAELLVALGTTLGVLAGIDLDDRDPRLGRRRDRLHDGGRHVVGGLYRRAAAGDGGRRTGRRAAVRARRRGRAGRRVAPLRGRAGGPRGPPAAGLRERRLLDPGGARRLVGRQPDADLRRHPVELLLPAGAVVPDARPRPVALHPVRPADDRAHGAAPALRRGGLRLRVAARPGRAAAARSRPTRSRSC